MGTFLKEIKISKSSKKEYPFNLPLFANGFSLTLNSPITFIVGENGSGKSTFLESLAKAIGFNTLGGNKNHTYANNSLDNFELCDNMKLSWSIKQSKGFFFRAETFFEFANNLDELAKFNDQRLYNAYGGKSLQKQSHGESFLAFFANQVKNGIFIFDEPEAALSPERQLTLIAILNQLAKTGNCQFIIATHSPLLITTPDSELYEIEDGNLIKKNYEETHQFKLYKDFLNRPDQFLRYLCDDLGK